MTTPNTHAVPPAEKLLYTLQINQSHLMHGCQEQIEALAQICGLTWNSQGVSHEHWASLLSPIAQQMELLCVLNDFEIEEAELRLVAQNQDIPIRSMPFAPREPDPRLQAARKAVKDARKALRKAQRESRQPIQEHTTLQARQN